MKAPTDCALHLTSQLPTRNDYIPLTSIIILIDVIALAHFFPYQEFVSVIYVNKMYILNQFN